MDQKRKPAGLILAAGFSSRMGDFKPLLKIDRHNPCLLYTSKPEKKIKTANPLEKKVTAVRAALSPMKYAIRDSEIRPPSSGKNGRRLKAASIPLE